MRRIKQRIKQIKKNYEKSGTANPECTLTEILDFYKEYVSEVRRNIQRAVMQLCPYTLIEDLSHHRVTSEEWKKMNKKERESRIKVIDPCYAKASDITDDAIKDDRCHAGEDVSYRFLKRGLPEMFRTSWKNANLILEKNGIASVPGATNTKVVISLANPDKPYFVRLKD